MGWVFHNKIRGVAYFVNYFNNGSKYIKIIQSLKEALATKNLYPETKYWLFKRKCFKTFLFH